MSENINDIVEMHESMRPKADEGNKYVVVMPVLIDAADLEREHYTLEDAYKVLAACKNYS